MTHDGIFGVQYLALPLFPVCDAGFLSVLTSPQPVLGRKLHFGAVAVFSGSVQRKVHVRSHTISKYSSEKPFRMKGALQINSNWMRTRRPMFVECGCIYRTARCEAASVELGSVRGQLSRFTSGL